MYLIRDYYPSMNLKTKVNGVIISTVDLMGIDHDGMFYETMVFTETCDEILMRYPTKIKACIGHWQLVWTAFCYKSNPTQQILLEGDFI